MPARVAIVLNGISRKKKKFYRDIYPVLQQSINATVFETRYAGHAIELASEASAAFEVIIAAGGDGTLNQVINGVLQKGATNTIGIIPLGTGNDFARTCGLTPDPEPLLDLLSHNSVKLTDLGKLTCQHATGEHVRYFINACSVGMGPAVVERLASGNRSLGPTLTYWKAITATFLTHRPQEVELFSDALNWKGKIRVLAIANGRSFGNGLHIAPEAAIDDGLLDLFLAGEVPLLKFLRFQQQMKTRKRVEDPLLRYIQSDSFRISSQAPFAIETEGEIAGTLPAKVEVIKSAVKFLR